MQKVTSPYRRHPNQQTSAVVSEAAALRAKSDAITSIIDKISAAIDARSVNIETSSETHDRCVTELRASESQARNLLPIVEGSLAELGPEAAERIMSTIFRIAEKCAETAKSMAQYIARVDEEAELKSELVKARGDLCDVLKKRCDLAEQESIRIVTESDHRQECLQNATSYVKFLMAERIAWREQFGLNPAKLKAIQPGVNSLVEKCKSALALLAGPAAAPAPDTTTTNSSSAAGGGGGTPRVGPKVASPPRRAVTAATVVAPSDTILRIHDNPERATARLEGRVKASTAPRFVSSAEELALLSDALKHSGSDVALYQELEGRERILAEQRAGLARKSSALREVLVSFRVVLKKMRETAVQLVSGDDARRMNYQFSMTLGKINYVDETRLRTIAALQQGVDISQLLDGDDVDVASTAVTSRALYGGGLSPSPMALHPAGSTVKRGDLSPGRKMSLAVGTAAPVPRRQSGMSPGPQLLSPPQFSSAAHDRHGLTSPSLSSLSSWPAEPSAAATRSDAKPSSSAGVVGATASLGMSIESTASSEEPPSKRSPKMAAARRSSRAASGSTPASEPPTPVIPVKGTFRMSSFAKSSDTESPLLAGATGRTDSLTSATSFSSMPSLDNVADALPGRTEQRSNSRSPQPGGKGRQSAVVSTFAAQPEERLLAEKPTVPPQQQQAPPAAAAVQATRTMSSGSVSPTASKRQSRQTSVAFSDAPAAAAPPAPTGALLPDWLGGDGKLLRQQSLVEQQQQQEKQQRVVAIDMDPLFAGLKFQPEAPTSHSLDKLCTTQRRLSAKIEQAMARAERLEESSRRLSSSASTAANPAVPSMAQAITFSGKVSPHYTEELDVRLASGSGGGGLGELPSVLPAMPPPSTRRVSTDVAARRGSANSLARHDSVALGHFEVPDRGPASAGGTRRKKSTTFATELVRH